MGSALPAGLVFSSNYYDPGLTFWATFRSRAVQISEAVNFVALILLDKREVVPSGVDVKGWLRNRAPFVHLE